MNSSLILRAGMLGLAVIAVLAGWNAVKDANDGLKLIFFIVIGAGLGLWAVKVLLPRLGDALVAQGDFKGAIRDYERLIESNPEDPLPLSEISRIHNHFLHDPESAIRVLESGLKERSWPVDAAVFLRLRMVDILSDDLHDGPKACEVLEQIIHDFPDTRHSVKARHRIYEMSPSRNPGTRSSMNPGDVT
jgi:tetratricopeptide (TPR) repeat protein